MEKQNYAIPAAIVIAGALIASGLYFGEPSTDQKASGPQVKLDEIISDLKINMADYARCVDNSATLAKIETDENNALALGAEGTPFSVIISKTGKKVVVPGAYPKADLEQLLKEAVSTTTTYANLEAIRPVTSADHAIGSPNATLTIVEYSDLRCPFCSRFQSTLNDIVKSRGDIRWVYRHFPLDQLHPDARALAVASECVASLGGNDKFWQFIDRVFELEDRLVTN
jgi:protein-disulfide isomerase